MQKNTCSEHPVQNFNLFVNMKQKLVIIASMLTLAISAEPEASAQWVQANPGEQVSYIFTAIGTNLFTLARDQADDGNGILQSTDSGQNWSFVNSSWPSFLNLTSVGSNLFACDVGVYQSTDSGATWSRRASNGLGMAWGGIIGSFLESNGKLFAASEIGVIFSTDSGTSWTETNKGLTDTLIDDLVLDGTNLYAGTSDSGIFLSTDNGMSWNPVNNGLTEYGNGIYPVCVMGTTLFAASEDSGVFRSTNNGSTWTPSGLMNAYVSQFAVSGANLFAGTQNFSDGTNCGVFLSTDSGASWTSVNTGLPDTSIQALAVCGPNLVAGTNSAGIWYRPLSQIIGTSSVAPNSPTQNSFAAFPNPFTKSTTISFTTPKSGASIGNDAAEVSIVNLLGSQVARLFEGELSVGEHTFTWNAANMPPGAYWAIVQMNGSVERVPIVLQ
jgi:photosystem II stability/assembly factor-like uncharacterized protein